MNALLGACYAAGMAVADVAAVLTSIMAPNAEHKVLRSLRARRGVLARWAAQSEGRDVSRPLVWWHAPSVGEGLQARPVAQAARRVHPDWQQAYSFYSPSAEPLEHNRPKLAGWLGSPAIATDPSGRGVARTPQPTPQ